MTANERVRWGSDTGAYPQTAVAIFIPHTGSVSQDERDTLESGPGATPIVRSRVAYTFALSAGQYGVRRIRGPNRTARGLICTVSARVRA